MELTLFDKKNIFSWLNLYLHYLNFNFNFFTKPTQTPMGALITLRKKVLINFIFFQNTHPDPSWG